MTFGTAPAIVQAVDKDYRKLSRPGGVSYPIQSNRNRITAGGYYLLLHLACDARSWFMT